MSEPPIDADLLDATVRSSGFLAIDARYVAMRAAKARELEQPLSAEQTAAARGFLAGVDACRRVPGILRDEADPKKRRRVQRGGRG